MPQVRYWAIANSIFKPHNLNINPQKMVDQHYAIISGCLMSIGMTFGLVNAYVNAQRSCIC